MHHVSIRCYYLNVPNIGLTGPPLHVPLFGHVGCVVADVRRSFGGKVFQGVLVLLDLGCRKFQLRLVVVPNVNGVVEERLEPRCRRRDLVRQVCVDNLGEGCDAWGRALVSMITISMARRRRNEPLT